MIIGYASTLTCVVGLLIAYLIIVKNKEFWITMLFLCITVVNLGYLLLSIAKTVEFAVFANDLAYLGSVFLSMCMFLTIVRLCGYSIKKIHVIICLTLAIIMFAIIATSGFLPWYYESVDIETVDGATMLAKEYGVLHPTYFVYLVAYFTAMITTIVHSTIKKKGSAQKFAGALTVIVLINIIVWFIQKFTESNFEFLAISYIVSEVLFVLLYWMMQDYIHKSEVPPPTIIEKKTVVVANSISKADKITVLLRMLSDDRMLTNKEIEILGELVEGKSRKEIAHIHCISENTVKTHVTHIYEKFEVTGKDALLALIHKD